MFGNVSVEFSDELKLLVALERVRVGIHLTSFGRNRLVARCPVDEDLKERGAGRSKPTVTAGIEDGLIAWTRVRVSFTWCSGEEIRTAYRRTIKGDLQCL